MYKATSVSTLLVFHLWISLLLSLFSVYHFRWSYAHILPIISTSSVWFLRSICTPLRTVGPFWASVLLQSLTQEGTWWSLTTVKPNMLHTSPSGTHNRAGYANHQGPICLIILHFYQLCFLYSNESGHIANLRSNSKIFSFNKYLL